MDSPCIKQTVCKVLNIFQNGKYLVAYVLNVCQNHTNGYYRSNATVTLQESFSRSFPTPKISPQEAIGPLGPS